MASVKLKQSYLFKVNKRNKSNIKPAANNNYSSETIQKSEFQSIEQKRIYIPSKPLQQKEQTAFSSLSDQNKSNQMMKMFLTNDIKSIAGEDLDNKLSVADKLSSCDPFEQYELIKQSPDILERLRLAELKAEQIPKLEEQLEQKTQIIAYLEQEVNNRAIGCIRCDQRKLLLAKMKNQIIQSNLDIMQKVNDLESNKNQLSSIQSEDYFQLCTKLDNQMNFQSTTIKNVLEKVMKLDQENGKLGQFTERMQNQGRQDRLHSIYAKDEIVLLKKNEEQLKLKIEQLNQQKLALWQENVSLKSNIMQFLFVLIILIIFQKLIKN